MLVFDEGIKARLLELNGHLAARRAARPAGEALRRLLEDNLGFFDELAPMSGEEIAAWSRGRPVVGVDGSVNLYGDSYPYILYIFQAVARPTKPLRGKERLICSSVISPLFPGDRKAFEEERRRVERENRAPESAWEGLRHRELARLEVEVAIRAAEEFEPALMIFDGGFMRYAVQALDVWKRYRKIALDRGILSVGVIEETATDIIVKTLGRSLPPGLEGEYDRSLLFGLLRPGESFRMREEIEFKSSEIYTAFARFSRHPQAVACDFFREQAGEAGRILNFLYTITPQGGRGFPLWLDIVDQETRITNQDVEMMLSTYLGRDLVEVFLMPHRERRDF